MGVRVQIGIEAINPYVSRAWLDVRELFEARRLDATRFGNLLMEQKSVSLPCEDAVSNGVNAAKPLLDALTPAERDKLELLVVSTESGIDLGKPISTYIHQHLGLTNRCRSFEVKHACYGGTAALQTAAAIVGASPVPDAKALVVATEAASASSHGSYWEPSEGAGAVAMLVSRRPDVLALDVGANGYHTFEVMDTARPRPDVDLVDSDISLLAYVKCLQESFGMYRERVQGADIVDTFDQLVFHTPFAGMVRGAHRSLLRREKRAATPVIDADFEARVGPSLQYCSRVGNLFSSALYLGLCSAIEQGPGTGPRRMGLFSYGSGCASEFFSGIVGPQAREVLARQSVSAALDNRRQLTVDQYDELVKLGEDRSFGVREAVFDTAPYQDLYDAQAAGQGLLVLDRIDNFHREYRWT